MAGALTLIGQSLELSHPALIGALRARDHEAVRARVLRQLEAGAGAIDINGGVHASAIDLAWCVRVAWGGLPGVPLLVDTASPAVIADVLTDCHHAGLAGPLVANALPARGDGSFDREAARALDAAARSGAGVVVSPRAADGPEAAGAADAFRIAAAALTAAHTVRAAGVTGPVYLDALAYPPLSDPVRCARSLDVIRAWRAAAEGIEPLTAVGNVGYGAEAGLAARLRAVYAAAAVGAGARALILPVEESATVRAARIAAGEIAPLDGEDAWLIEVAETARLGKRPAFAPEAYEQAARLVLGDAR